ncbi:MAG TPA: SGNH/GDSL hydrolase family protein [Clostridiales bacterium]|nr:SGNH/GDSL hydrolase family protein [Clostridiales bacterium]HQH62770.1 SGNH/GDSL hydrolase family protein [Clostridiales bacterium]HQK73015.1 SGNH/GDSL hydrolase family protein [Clostridiales bacterium]
MAGGSTRLRDFDPLRSEAKVYGLAGGGYCRVPDGLLGRMSKELAGLARQTSGGRIRFVTDSDTLRVSMEVLNEPAMPHMPSSGSSGLDFFEGDGADMKYIGTRQPACGQKGLEAEIPLSEGDKTVTVYLPLYNGVRSLRFAIARGASLQAPLPYRHEKPVVFYGSSITQGGCASRPSNSYCAMLAKRFDSDFINLGFSGNAKGELYMAEYIAELEMSCFVLDYDHNAPDAAHLRRTHLPFLQTILERRPRLPVLMLSRPDTKYSAADNERRDIVRDSYLWAKQRGYDAFFIDGAELFGEKDRDCCTVDGCHPNDLGFYRMAQAVEPVMKAIFSRI